MSVASSAVVGTVSLRAAQWIARVLREAGMPSEPFRLATEAEGISQVELRVLNVKHLKKISSELSSRTIRYHNDNLSASIVQNLIFHPPKSGAKKAQWISAIAEYFQGQALNNIYNILDGVASAAASSSASAAVAARARKPSPAGAKGTKALAAASSSAPAAAAARARKPSPARAKGAKKSPTARRKSPSKAKASKSTGNASTKNRSATFGRPAPSHAATLADEAMARALQNQYMRQDMGHAMSQFGRPAGSNPNGVYQPWGGPLAPSSMQNNIGNAAGGSNQMVGLKRPANNVGKPKNLPVKVKREPASHTTASYGTYSSTSSAAASANASDNLQPRDFRESNMVGSLREMGFTDTREILTALRAVAAEREEVAVVCDPQSTGWSSQEQVEAAMMWIVSQREEAAEAQKLDEARISSEQADAAMEQSRKQSMEQELRNADLVDLLGSTEDNDALEISSRHFPCSVLLRHQSVKAVLKAVASEDSLGHAKDQVIRLLSLEKKARKWYGTVLPFSYFEHVLSPRFGILAMEQAPAEMCRRLVCESDELERVMYNLSEQEDWSIGSVPKVFVAAQRDAAEKGKPTSEREIGTDGDVQVVQHQLGGRSSSSASNGDIGRSGNRKIEVIDVE